MKSGIFKRMAAAMALAVSFAFSAYAAWQPGLQYGYIDGGLNKTDYPTVTAITLSPEMAKTPQDVASETTGQKWKEKRTEIYWGKIYLDGSTYRFGEYIFDNTFLKIGKDGVLNLVINGTSYQNADFGTVTTDSRGSTPWYTEAGWYDFEVRFYWPSGRGGPRSDEKAPNHNFSNTKGFGYVKGTYDEVATLTTADWIFPEDDGSASFFRYDDGLGFDDLLTIKGEPQNYSVPTPEYGDHNGYNVNQSYGEFSAVSPWISSDGSLRATCLGYEVEVVDADTGAVITNYSGQGSSFSYKHLGQTTLTWLWSVRVAASVEAPVFIGSTCNSANLRTTVGGFGFDATSANLSIVYGISPAAMVCTNTTAITDPGTFDTTLLRLKPDQLYYAKAVLESNTGDYAESDVMTFKTGKQTEGEPGLWQTFFTSADKDWTKDIWSLPIGEDYRNYSDSNRIRRRELSTIGAYSKANNGAVTYAYTSEIWGDQVCWPVSGGQFAYAGYIYLDASKTYKFRTKIDDNEYLAITDAGTGVKTVLINDVGGANTVQTSSSYTPSVTGYHEIEIRFSDGTGGAGGYSNGSSYKNTDNAGYSDDNGATWKLMSDPGDGSLFSTGVNVKVKEVIENGALAAIDLEFNPAAEARKLTVVYGSVAAGNNISDWEDSAEVATIAAGATSYRYTVPAEWGSDDFCVIAFCLVGSFNEWSSAVFWQDYSGPVIGDVIFDGTGGDTLVVSGNLLGFNGNNCTLSVYTGSSETELDTVWTGLADSVRTETGEFSFALFDGDENSLRYFTPGEKYYAVVEAVSDGKVTRSQIGSVTMSSAAVFGGASSSVNRRTVTFTGSFKDLGADNRSTVTLYVGEENNADALVAVESVVVAAATGNSFSITHTFDTYEKTYYYQLRAVNETTGKTAQIETRTAVASCKTIDSAVYTWKDSVASGNWNDPANWTDDNGGDSLGYPTTAGSTATFNRLSTAEVILDGVCTIGTLDLSSSEINVTFKCADGMTTNNTLLTVSAFKGVGPLSQVTLDGAALKAGNVEFENGEMTLKNAANFYLGDFKNEKSGKLTILSDSWFSCGTLSVGGLSEIVINDATLYSRSNSYIGNGTNDKCDLRFEGKKPRWYHSYKSANFQSGRQWSSPQLNFLVPIGGYDAAPITCVADQNNYFGSTGANNGQYVMRVNVLDESPANSVDGTITTELISWTKGINTNKVYCSSLPLSAGQTESDDAFILGEGEYPTTLSVTINGNAHTGELLVSGAPENYAADTITYGYRTIEEGGVTVTAPANYLLSNTRRVVCDGWKLYSVNPTTLERTLSRESTDGDKLSCTVSSASGLQELVFTWREEYRAVVTVNGVGTGAESAWTQYGTPVTLTATPPDGLVFAYWTGDVNYNDRFNEKITLNGPVSVTPHFAPADGQGLTFIAKDENGSWYDLNHWIVNGETPTRLPSQYDDVIISSKSDKVTRADSGFWVKSLSITNAVLAVNITNNFNIAACATSVSKMRTDTASAKAEVYDFPGGYLWAMVDGDLTIGGLGYLCMGAQFQRAYTQLTVDGNLTIGEGALVMNAGSVDMGVPRAVNTSYYILEFDSLAQFYQGDNFLKVAGKTTIETGGALVPGNDYTTGYAVWLNMGDVEIKEGGEINVIKRGYAASGGEYKVNGKTATGCPIGTYTFDAYNGASHGGLAGLKNVGGQYSTEYPVYDYEYTPLYPGMGSQNYAGGGTVRLDAENLIVSGSILADGINKWGTFGGKGGSAGGSIFINCQSFELGDNAIITAKGGNGQATYSSGGGGGRIAIGVELTAEQREAIYATKGADLAGIKVSQLTDAFPGRVSVEGGENLQYHGGGQEGTAVYMVNSSGKVFVDTIVIPALEITTTPITGLVTINAGEDIVFSAPNAYAFETKDGRSRRLLTGCVITSGDQVVYDSEETPYTVTDGVASFTLTNVNYENLLVTWSYSTLQHHVEASTVVGEGTITLTGADSDGWADDGATLSVSATPADGYEFLGFGGDIYGDDAQQPTVTFADNRRSRVITATFAQSGTSAVSWTGEGDGLNWTDPDNWSSKSVPLPTTDVTIDLDGAVVHRGTLRYLACKNLTIGSTATLAISNTVFSSRWPSDRFDQTVAHPAVGKEEDSAPVKLTVNGNLALNGKLILGYQNSLSRPTLNVSGNMNMGEGALFTIYTGYDPLLATQTESKAKTDAWKRGGSEIIIGGSLALATGAWVYPYSDALTGASPVFRLGGNLTVAEGAGFNADGKGYGRCWYNGNLCVYFTSTHSLGGNWYGGGSHYGAGTSNPDFVPYDNLYAPCMPGVYGFNGDDRGGGGVIRIYAKGTAYIRGTLTAEGKGWNSGGGTGAGGTVYLAAKKIRTYETSYISAAGSQTGSASLDGGSGGGGHICLAINFTDEDLDRFFYNEPMTEPYEYIELEAPTGTAPNKYIKGSYNVSTIKKNENTQYHGYEADGIGVILDNSDQGLIMILR